MKRNFLSQSLWLIIASGAVVQAQDGSGWPRIKVNDEEFSVTLPTVPAMRTTEGAEVKQFFSSIKLG